MPLYKVMYDGAEPPKPLNLVSESDKNLWGNARGEARELSQLRRHLAKMDQKQRTLVLGFAGRMARSTSK
jgi:hypothetical protein